jgi:two-component system copper resistance phosphate regulon response regulator CusR
MRVLLIEDDPRLADVLRRSLTEHGCSVDIVNDGVVGQNEALHGDYDILVLDVMLPSRDGLSVAANLRSANNATPILMLTARDTLDDIVAGLDAGADDYLVKPFELAELEARMRSVSRRMKPNPGKILSAHGVELDLASGYAKRGERLIRLTGREMAFLRLFLCNIDRIVSRSMIEDALWDRHRDSGASNIIDVYIARLRAKLTVEGEPQLIHTFRKLGYRFGLTAD